MVVHTWGFVQSRPDSPWVKVELRAEPGAVFRVSGLPYAAMQLAHTLEKHARMSKRVHNHLRRLAAGHALWEGRERVLTDDVQAAFDVLWMNRSGWWGSP